MSENAYRKIVVVTDGLSSTDAVHGTAKNIALQHQASLTLVDTVKTPGLLSRWFSSNSEDVFEMVLADKKNRLNELVTDFSTLGIRADSNVLVGSSAEMITREVLETGADLVIRYKKGAHSRQPGRIGTTARSLMRFCPAPVLLVGDDEIKQAKILTCVDADHDGKENNAVLSESLRLAQSDEDLSGLYCWDMYAKDLLKSRMSPETFQESLDLNRDRHEKIFADFKSSHANEIQRYQGGMHIENGEPEFVIPQFAKDHHTDVVVMCSVSLNHPLKRMIGSTVDAVIEKLECGLLVVKPNGFVSPITLES